MFKYKHILDNLSISQKIRLLTDAGALGEIEFKAQGLPSVSFGDFDKYCKKLFLSPYSMANAYDRELFYKAAKAVFIDMSRDGVNCALVKGPKIKINPYDNSYSEDVELSVAIVSEILRAANDLSMAVCLTDFNVTRYDIEWLDKKPDIRIIRDYVISPFAKVLEAGRCVGMFVDNVNSKSDYYKVNEELRAYALCGKLAGFDGFLLSRHTSAHDTVGAINRGEICLDASANILKAAYDKYLALKDGISKGKTTVGELIAEEEAGNAISLESIDQAIERLVEFAFECNKTNVSLLNTNADAPEIYERILRASTVLLKNNKKAIPVNAGDSVAIIGDILNYPDRRSFSDESEKYIAYLQEQGIAVTGYARGYEIGNDLSKLDAASACELVKNSSKAIVFLGKTHNGEKYITETENLHLDANQMYLIESLASYAYKIIYVLCTSYSLDAGFTDYGSAAVLSPDPSHGAVITALNVIIGKDNAEGKLSKPMYSDTDSFEKGKIYRRDHKDKVGPFMGYRYMDSAGLDTAYPLGSGIVGAKFKVSNIKVSENEITFKVKNPTKRAGSDIFELFLGMENSNLALPKKELVGFAKVTLDAGEEKEVSIPFRYSVFDKEQGKYIFPRGEYRISLGASLDKIYYCTKINLGSEELSCKTKDRLSDYLQSESNVVLDKYTLEADYKLMKKSNRNIVFGVGAMLLAILLALLSMGAGITSAFIYVIAAILFGASIVFFVLQGADASKLDKIEREKIDLENKKHFEDAEKIPVFSAEQMFVNEFDSLHLEVSDDADAFDYMEDEYFKYVNKDFKFHDLVADFEVFSKEKGFKLDAAMIREIFSSLASSRLVVTKMDEESYSALVSLLCEYFECPVCIDRVDESYTTEDSVLIRVTEDGGKVKTNVMKGLEFAQKSLQNISLVALTNVSCNNVSSYFVPYAKYIRNPLSNIYVNYQDELGAAKRLPITKNVWFMINIAGDSVAYEMPAYIGEVSALQKIAFTRCAPAEANPDLNKLKFYQFDYMVEKSKSGAFVSEDVWKKIDKLEEIAGASNGRRMTNKVTVGFEKYVNVYALCGGDGNEGLYLAVNSKLLPYFAAENYDAGTISALCETLETVFGEENVYKCQRSLKENSKSAAN